MTVRLAGRRATRRFVFRTQASNEFGHDRRADRAEAALLAYDLFGRYPDARARARRRGASPPTGASSRCGGAGEFWLATGWAEGTLYAEDLRRIAREGARPARPRALRGAGALPGPAARARRSTTRRPGGARCATSSATARGSSGWSTPTRPTCRRRRRPGSARSRSAASPRAGRSAAAPARLTAHPRRLPPLQHRLRAAGAGRGGSAFTLLDASRGGRGDPADDVTALSVNYVFFALDHPGAWARGLGALWRRFWEVYLGARGDAGRAGERAALPRLARARARLPALLPAPRRGRARRAARARRAGARRGPARPGRRGAALRGGARAVSGGAVVWVTGLPASGKSTLARARGARLAARGRPAALLDGDAVRPRSRPRPGYDAAGRAAFYETLGDLALLLAGQGLVAVVAATAHRRAFRDRVRAACPRFVEVFVDTPAEVCATSNPKRLWAQRPRGRGARAARRRPRLRAAARAGGDRPRRRGRAGGRGGGDGARGVTSLAAPDPGCGERSPASGRAPRRAGRRARPAAGPPLLSSRDDRPGPGGLRARHAALRRAPRARLRGRVARPRDRVLPRRDTRARARRQALRAPLRDPQGRGPARARRADAPGAGGGEIFGFTSLISGTAPPST